MFSQKKRFLVLLTIWGATWFSSCKTPQLHQNEALLQASQELPVQGRPAFRFSLGKEKSFRFGGYQIQDIRRGWTNRAGSVAIPVLTVEEASQKYSFAVADSARQQTWQVQAAATLRATTAQVAGFSANLDKQREFLQVAYRSPQSGEWRLSLADPGSYMQRQDFKGELSNGITRFEIRPLYKWKGRALPSGTALGYEVAQDGHIVASVQTVNNGKVWLRNGLSPDLQQVLASACGSLLLYNQLEEEKP